MFASNWRYLFALIGIAFLGAGIGEYHSTLNYPQQERYPRYRYAADKEANLETGTPPNPESFEYRYPCSNPKGRDESDLCAQWKAASAAERGALWAECGFWISFISLLLSGAGLVALIITIQQGRKALKRARQANKLAQKTADRQLRPYVGVSKVYIRAASGGTVWADFENYGQTPARNVKIKTRDLRDERNAIPDVNFGPINPGQVRYHASPISPIELGETLIPIIEYAFSYEGQNGMGDDASTIVFFLNAEWQTSGGEEILLYPHHPDKA